MVLMTEATASQRISLGGRREASKTPMTMRKQCVFRFRINKDTDAILNFEDGCTSLNFFSSSSLLILPTSRKVAAKVTSSVVESTDSFARSRVFRHST